MGLVFRAAGRTKRRGEERRGERDCLLPCAVVGTGRDIRKGLLH